MKKLFTKKGSAEIVSIVLGIVVIGGLALAVTGGLSKSTKNSLQAGLSKQSEDVGGTYKDAKVEPTVTPPNFSGN
jgi:hypothetical protein